MRGWAGTVRLLLSVLRGPLDVVNDEDVDRSFDRFESQAELFLERSEDQRSTGWFGSLGRGAVAHQGHTSHLGFLSRKLDANIESSGDPGLVYHWTVQDLSEHFGEFIESRALEFHRGGRHRADIAHAIFLPRLEPRWRVRGIIGRAAPFGKRVQLQPPARDR